MIRNSAASGKFSDATRLYGATWGGNNGGLFQGHVRAWDWEKQSE